MTHIEKTRKKTNVLKDTREKKTYASTHDSRTKKDIDEIDIYDDVITEKQNLVLFDNLMSVV
jgi:BRCT domain type II-containing protein